MEITCTHTNLCMSLIQTIGTVSDVRAAMFLFAYHIHNISYRHVTLTQIYIYIRY